MNLIGSTEGLMLRGTDDGSGGGGDVAPAPEAPVAAPEAPPAAAPAEPAFDPRASYEQLNQRYGESQQALAALYQATQESNKRWGGIQDIFKKMAGVEDQKPPEWQQAMNGMRGEMTQQMQKFFMEQKLKQDLPKLESEAADLFATATTPQDKQDVRNFLISVWSQFQNHQGRGHDSLSDSVKFVNTLINKVVDHRQKSQQLEYAQGKQGQQQALRGSGPAGTPPPPRQGEKQKPDTGEVTDDDVRQAMEAVKGIADI